MAKYFLSIAFILGVTTHELFAQNTPIQLDRPDQTECPFIVPKKFIQLENGFTLENINSELKSYSHPSTLWKYGLNDNFEFRLITEFVTERDGSKTVTGLIPITLGIKTSICQENGIVPIISLIGHITTAKIGSKAFHTSFIAPSFRFAMQHTITDKISIAYNLGAEWDGESAEQTYIYTFVTGFSLSEKLGAYLEIYGFAPKTQQADHRFDGGLTYLIHNDCMIDVSGGFGLTNNAPKNYVSLGFSYRFKTSKRVNETE